jgi:hypothetical protein
MSNSPQSLARGVIEAEVSRVFFQVTLRHDDTANWAELQRRIRRVRNKQVKVGHLSLVPASPAARAGDDMPGHARVAI